MKEFWKNYLENNMFFWVFSIIGVCLMIAGFILPPLGVIDNSVLIGTGEINGFVALGAVIKAIDKGVNTSLKHNGTEVVIQHPGEDITIKEEEAE